MESIRLKARAKINLGLDVIGRRENGYHQNNYCQNGNADGWFV